MKKMFAFVLLGLAVTAAAQASQLDAYGRIYTFSCSYFTNMSSDFEIQYDNHDLPWGTRVTLVYGWIRELPTYGGDPSMATQYQWEDTDEVDLLASAPYRWTAVVSKVLAERSNPTRWDSLVFVLRVELPDGRVQYEKGGNSTKGFYLVPLTRLKMESTCVQSGQGFPSYRPLRFVAVDRY